MAMIAMTTSISTRVKPAPRRFALMRLAARSLAKIGGPAIERAWYGVKMSDDPLERELCTWIIAQVQGGEVARLVLEHRTAHADFTQKPRYQAARALLAGLDRLPDRARRSVSAWADSSRAAVMRSAEYNFLPTYRARGYRNTGHRWAGLSWGNTAVTELEEVMLAWRLDNRSDLRDAKITVMPDGQLMLCGAEALHDKSKHTHQSLFKGARNAFFDPKAEWQLSDVALSYIAGLIEQEMSLGDMMTLLKLRHGDYSLVSEKLPLCRFYIIGPHLPDEIAERKSANVEIVGHVPDLRVWLERMRLSVAPLRYGSGAKGKIVSSLASGLPCVATDIASEGMGFVNDEHLAIEIFLFPDSVEFVNFAFMVT
jgi:hypothetical protein